MVTVYLGGDPTVQAVIDLEEIPECHVCAVVDEFAWCEWCGQWECYHHACDVEDGTLQIDHRLAGRGGPTPMRGESLKLTTHVEPMRSALTGEPANKHTGEGRK